MPTSPIHLFRQGPVLRALLATAARSLVRRGAKGAPEIPGPVLTETVPPRHPALVRDYLRAVGGDPSWYRGVLPPHLFPQWGFPLLSRALAPLPYDLSRVINAGCRLEIRRPLPAGEPLVLEGRLSALDDDGRRALVTQRLVTGTASQPRALVAEVTALFPLRKKKDADPEKKKKKKKEPIRIPREAREIDRWRLSATSGLDFAILTGDFNPIHWIPPYARLAGFSSTILHGFATMARAVESLDRQLWSGDPTRLRALDVRFVRPVVLPGRVGVFVDGVVDGEGELYVGRAPCAPACLTGRFTASPDRGSASRTIHGTSGRRAEP